MFNVGDIKPAEKELSFVMDLAWDVSRWTPAEAHRYTEHWAAKTFGPALAHDIARLQQRYYRLQASGKDAHVWFVQYTEEQVARRLEEARSLEAEVELLAQRVPERLHDAFFELVGYPIRGAALLNEYQLLARRSMVCATRGDSLGAMADANRVRLMFDQLNRWTRHYNEEVQNGKWNHFFSWQPYHWFRSEKIDPPCCSPEIFAQAQRGPKPRMLFDAHRVESDLASGSLHEIRFDSDAEGEVPLWIEALTPIQHFSKEAKDNVFCRITTATDDFYASATPINNVWHAPYVGPMWSQVGTLHVKKGANHLRVTDIKPDARIDRIYLGLWPPFADEPRLRIPASAFSSQHDAPEGHITMVEGLGYTDGLLVLPFDTPSYEPATAPYVEYMLNILPTDKTIEVRTLPTLHVYGASSGMGRDARFAILMGQATPQVFSIHANDFTAEWRWNVLRGYASRCITIPPGCNGLQRLRVYLLDPGITLQEVLVN